MKRRNPHPSGPRSRIPRFAAAALSVVLGIGVSFGSTGVGQALAHGHGHAKAKPQNARQAPVGGSVLVNEGFRGVDAPEFVGVGSACLTGAAEVPTPPGSGDHTLGGCDPGTGPVPPNGAASYGYLRLTDARHNQSGAVLYDHPLPANEGLDVTFDQWQYGSTTPANPADGISFFLVDGSGTLSHPGAFGGSLGYAQKLPDNDASQPFLPGVDNGYVGIGLDVLGNYFGDWEHRGNGCPPGQRSPSGTGFYIPAPGENMVTVRGPGNGTEGYCFMTATTSNFTTSGRWPSTLPGKIHGPTLSIPPGATPQQAEAAIEPSRRRVHVAISPAPNPVITVSVDFNDTVGFRQVLQTPAPANVPPTYKFGFAASTGAFTDVHLLRNVVVTSDQPLPQLNLVKQVVRPLPGDLTVGSQVPYQFVVTNSGNVPIDNLVVNDPKIGPVHCPSRTLDVNETITCTATYIVTANDVRHGSIDNTATASGTADGAPVDSPPSSEHLPLDQPPALELEKAVQTPGPYVVGQTVTYTYTVRNTGGTVLNNIAVKDDHVTGIICQANTLQPLGSPGDSTTCTGSYTITPADGSTGSVLNTATASGTTPEGRPVTSPEAYQKIPVGAPHLTLTKSPDQPGPFFVGDTVHYTYTVTNTGTTELRGVVVVDDHVSGVTCDATTLASGRATTCHGQYVVTQADFVACGTIRPCELTNQATAVGNDPAGNEVPSEEASATVEIREHAPSLSLIKRADQPGPFLVGQTVRYTYEVQNTGTNELHNVRVTDDRVANTTCDATDLTPGQTTFCHGAYTVTQADIDHCDTVGDPVCYVVNIAVVHGNDPSGNDVRSEEAAEQVEVREIPAPGLSVTKTPVESGPFFVGDTVHYTYHVTNTGNTVLNTLLITDDHVPGISCDTTSLGSGQSTTCHGAYVVRSQDLVCDSTGTCHVTNTAVAQATDPEGNEVRSEEATATIEAREHAPSLDLTKSADEPGPFSVGDTVHFTYHVTNTGTNELHGLQIVDNHVNGITCDATDLPTGASTTCHGTYVILQQDLVCDHADPNVCHVTNTAVAAALEPSGNQILSDEATATLTVGTHAPAIDLTKSADEPGPFRVGDTVHYTYTVHNTGNTELHGLTVTDNHVGGITCDTTDLAAGASTKCHGTYTVAAQDLTCDTPDPNTCRVTNIATATATDPTGAQVPSDEATATITVHLHAPALTVTKAADEPGPYAVGDTVHYTYHVTNAGNAELHALQVTDNHVNNITCDSTDLVTGASTTCHGTYVVLQQDLVCDQTDPNVCHVTNTATATGTDPTGNVVHSDETTATITVHTHAPALSVTKAADEPGPFQVGDTVNYTYTVHNNGTTDLQNLQITDNRVTDITCDELTLTPGASTTCHGTYVVAQQDLVCDSSDPNVCRVTNTAVATAHDPTGALVESDETTATITVHTHTPALRIIKKADEPGPFRVGDTVNYTYTVTNSGSTELNNLTVTDDHVTGITCDTTDLVAGASTTCHGTYVILQQDLVCDQTDPNVCHVTNTAVAHATDPSGNQISSDETEYEITVLTHAHVPALSISKKAEELGPFLVGDTVHYTYTVTNSGSTELHGLTITDNHVTGIACDTTDLTPGQSTTCHGTYKVTEADLVCDQTDPNTCHVTNTATATATDPSGNQVHSNESEFTITVHKGAPAMSLDKESVETGPFAVGDTVHYTYRVRNTGTTALHNLQITDNLVTGITCDTTDLTPGQSTTCHGTYKVTEADLVCDQAHPDTCHVTNTAVATATDPSGHQVQSDQTEFTIIVCKQHEESRLDLSKKADEPGPFQVGDTVHYTYTVRNSGSTELRDLRITDNLVTGITCDELTLTPGQSSTCHGTYKVTERDLMCDRVGDTTVCHVTNKAVAEATDPSGHTVHSKEAGATIPVCFVKGHRPPNGKLEEDNL